MFYFRYLRVENISQNPIYHHMKKKSFSLHPRRPIAWTYFGQFQSIF